MATEFGTPLIGPHLALRPDTANGGQILTDLAPFASLALKTHVAYAGSFLGLESRSLTTTDATATVIFTKSVPLSTTLGVWVLTVGKKVGANADGIVSFKYNACTNNATTVAAVGTTGGSDLENSSGAPAVTIVANDTADTIEVKVAGVASETWAWTSYVFYAQVTSSS